MAAQGTLREHTENAIDVKVSSSCILQESLSGSSSFCRFALQFSLLLPPLVVHDAMVSIAAQCDVFVQLPKHKLLQIRCRGREMGTIPFSNILRLGMQPLKFMVMLFHSYPT
jgi:hypothetical protein